jgi:hypothetical protein
VKSGLWLDQWHRYHVGDSEPIVGATTPLKIQDVLIGGNLTTWAANQAVDAILEGRPWNGADDAQIRFVALERVNRARTIGTAVHDEIAALLKGEERPPAQPDVTPYLWSWTKFLQDERPEFLHVEQRVIHPDRLYAGTFDFIAKIHGRVALGDVKTGRFKESAALQLAAYSMCLMVDEDDPTARPLPRIKDYYILLLSPTGYELRPVTVTADERRHYLKLAKAYHTIRAWDEANKEGTP